MLDKRNFYIKGNWTAPIKSNDFQVINPSNEELCAIISLGGAADVNSAVKAAKEAFSSWSQTSKDEKISLIQKLYEIYKSRWSEMAESISLEMGAPIDWASTAQTSSGAAHIKDFIKRLKEFEFELSFSNESDNYIAYEPIGVCGLITPWNWPINQITLKVIPALAAGCTMILKPSDAVREGISNVMSNSGQSCDAPTRMLVEKSIYERAVKEAAEEANNIKVDLAQKKGEHIGPVVSKTQFDKIQDLIQSGIDEGATLVAGGPSRPDGLDKGYFVRPTIFTDVSNNMRIAKEEIFGPVLSIIPFENEEEAIAITNDTSYGLGNYVQTQDKEKARRVARKFRSGGVYINGKSADAGTPFGGYRQSGNGREGGTWGIEEYLEVKTISGWK